MLDRLLTNTKAKWVFVIGFTAVVGAGITAKHVIPYPTECITEEIAQIFEQH